MHADSSVVAEMTQISLTGIFFRGAHANPFVEIIRLYKYDAKETARVLLAPQGTQRSYTTVYTACFCSHIA